MKTMESELEKLDNELYLMYSRSLEIAELKWLPGIKPKKDSYNSYPHFRGVMGQIDRLLYEDEENSFVLNGTELYILLNAVLMHDIGKGIKGKDHGFESYNVITQQWADLGIPTKKVAEIVAEICRFHSCPDKTEMEKLYEKYYTDQFQRLEPVRGRLLGALLFLGDHMDDSFRRVVPHYLKKQNLLEVVGNFRSKITDVKLDRQNKMIREILDKSCFQKNELRGARRLYGDLDRYLDLKIGDNWGEVDEKSVLYMIAKDVMENERQVALIKDELNIMDMPVKKWLIECDEQLFQIYMDRDESGHEIMSSRYALEPIINLDYCLEVLKGICMLSGGIFARQFFFYSDLVNFIREEEQKTYKVKCAVRRLSLLLKAEGACDYVIYYDEYNWSFYCQKKMEPQNGVDQKELVFEQMKEKIRQRLGEDHG